MMQCHMNPRIANSGLLTQCSYDSVAYAVVMPRIANPKMNSAIRL
jgi:hypothetical protein